MSHHDSTSNEDYLPARMLNEFVYCPRLFYLEHVEGLFAHNADTVEGAARHRRVDRKADELPTAADAAKRDEIHARSVTLSSDQYGVIAKLDLIEAEGNVATPVDYKRGSPKKLEDGSLGAWDPERVQICVQALVLRENGYQCYEGVIFFWETRQRVRIAIDDELVAETRRYIELARRTMESHQMPPPLVNSPKCPRCSLVTICLPDETTCCTLRAAGSGDEPVVQPLLFDMGPRFSAGNPFSAEAPPARLRQLVTPRDERRPLYLNTQGFSVGISSQVLQVKEKYKVVQKVRLHDVSHVNLFGNVQVSTQAVQALLAAEIPLVYFSYGGWFRGITQPVGLKNIMWRREQFRMADSPEFCLRLARQLVVGKVRNQRTMLMRNHVEPPRQALQFLKAMIWEVERASGIDTLLGLEGMAARVYFENFPGMIKVGGSGEAIDPDGLPDGPLDDHDAEFSVPTEPREPTLQSNGNPAGKNQESAEVRGSPDVSSNGVIGRGKFSFDFERRNRRPPRDPVNALLSLGYSLLSKDLTIACAAVGLDPFLGYYHQLRFGRPALALDLMEPFRPLIVDSAVLSSINQRMVTETDFIAAGDAVALTQAGRKSFFQAYEQRMDQLVTHPLFGYRVSYRRLLEIQTRLLARVLLGELWHYPVFLTR